MTSQNRRRSANTVKGVIIFLLIVVPCIVVGALLGGYLQGTILAGIGGVVGMLFGLCVRLGISANEGHLPEDDALILVAVLFGGVTGLCLLGMGIAAAIKMLY